MGHTNAPMVLGTLGAIEMGLKALDIPQESKDLILAGNAQRMFDL